MGSEVSHTATEEAKLEEPPRTPAASGGVLMPVALRQGLLDLEFSMLWTAQDAWWKEKREVWRKMIALATTTVEQGRTAVLELERSLKWAAQEAEWKLMRARWRDQTAAATTPADLASSALALERGVAYSYNSEKWKEARTAWVRSMQRVGGSFDKCPFPEKEATVKAPGGSLRIKTSPLGSGAFRHAYEAKVADGTPCGFKEGSDTVVKAIQASHFNQGVRMGPEDIEAQRVARRYAVAFNAANVVNKKVFFRVGDLMKSPRALFDADGRRIVTAGETLLVEAKIHGEWEKFNSNSGWSQGVHTLPDLFSHWTFVNSKGRHLVCDLQGHRGRPGGPKYDDDTDYYLFTDPVVMSLTREFGSTDLGLMGMVQWLVKHKCSPLCRSSGLPNTQELLQRLTDSDAPGMPFQLLRDTFGTIDADRSTIHGVGFLRGLQAALGAGTSLDVSAPLAAAIVRALNL